MTDTKCLQTGQDSTYFVFLPDKLTRHVVGYSFVPRTQVVSASSPELAVSRAVFRSATSEIEPIPTRACRLIVDGLKSQKSLDNYVAIVPEVSEVDGKRLTREERCAYRTLAFAQELARMDNKSPESEGLLSRSNVLISKYKVRL